MLAHLVLGGLGKALSLKVRDRSENVKRESELSVKKGSKKPRNRKMKESEACKKQHGSYGELT